METLFRGESSCFAPCTARVISTLAYIGVLHWTTEVLLPENCWVYFMYFWLLITKMTLKISYHVEIFLYSAFLEFSFTFLVYLYAAHKVRCFVYSRHAWTCTQCRLHNIQCKCKA